MRNIGVVRFMGTNCDQDVFDAITESGSKAHWLWHRDQFDINSYEALVLPGGFSYGDYLRSGALAARSPVMKSVSEAAKKGMPILGICNGFQVLCEAGLLPGALVRNESGRFIDDWVNLKLQNSQSFFAKEKKVGELSRLPVAHGDGRYYASKDSLKEIFDHGQVWWTYTENPNGSLSDVAGVMNKEKNVCGLMPHPERAIFDWMGGVDGYGFFI